MEISLKNFSVVVSNTKKEYPQELPFHPSKKYPEYTGRITEKANQIYDGVRNTFFRMGLDRSNYGKESWNPLGELINPGMTVFLKPNTVVHEHEEKKDLFSIIVHGSVIRPILDYVCIALKGNGRIVIGDSQLLFSDFDKAMEASLIEGLLKWYRTQTTVDIECIDLRTHRGVRTYLYGKWGRKPINQDRRGYRFVDLGSFSFFEEIDPHRLRIAVANHKNMFKHHSNGKHEYMFPQSFLDSDVVINIPKLKTHRRTAITVAIKNFMGLPSFKDSLPHFITGHPEDGGDQYIHNSRRKKIVTALHDQIQSNPYIPVKFVCAVVKRLLWESQRIVPFKDDVYEAMWYGNDTLWRTLFDLNNVALFADKNGRIQKNQQRKYLCLVDGIVSGENNGPLLPDPVYTGVLVGGFNPIAVDAVCATLMGFDIKKIPTIYKAFASEKINNSYFLPNSEVIEVLSEDNIISFKEFSQLEHFKFEPHPGWKGHVEKEQ